MNITHGLSSSMVLQRNRRNECEQLFSGESSGSGTLRATVSKGARPVKGFNNIEIGRSTAGKVKGCLHGLTAGGPYTIALAVENKAGKVVDKAVIKDVLVGDLWILGGQSNMEGIGALAQAPRPNSMVHVFTMDDHWEIAKEPIHVLADAVDPVHREIRGGSIERVASHLGTGPGVAFGLEMHRFSSIPQGLIPCAHGGSSMMQWSPELKNQGGHSLYGATIRRVVDCGGKVAGIVWYQGCSDADEAQAKVYTDRMKKLIGAFRRDCRDKELPFVVVQISRVAGARYGGHQWWNSIRDQQRRLPSVIRNVLTVPAIDLSLEDGIHISGKDCIVVGRRCAQAMAVLRYKVRHIKPPIALKSVAVEKDRNTGCANIRVTFTNVMGGLCAAGRPFGFDLTERQYEITNDFVFRTDLDGSSVLLKTIVMPEEAGTFWLYYGYGTHPYCNITDEAGRSLPMLGPVHLGRYRAFTPFIRKVRVSPLLPSAGNLETLSYPAGFAAIQLSPRLFPENFCSLHPEIMAAAPEDKLIYYAFDFRNDEPMQLKLHLGYDGPVKVWYDGAEAYADPEGTNPAMPFDASIPLSPAAGRHEVLIALASNRGRAWGLHIRMTREDVSGAVIASGKYAMPEILG